MTKQERAACLRAAVAAKLGVYVDGLSAYTEAFLRKKTDEVARDVDNFLRAAAALPSRRKLVGRKATEDAINAAVASWMAHTAAFMFNQTMGVENVGKDACDIRSQRLRPWMSDALTAAHDAAPDGSQP